jgi:long-chain acyl-CoA synthetase
MLRVLGEAIQKQESRHALQSIKWCISGGAALPPALVEQLANAGLPVLEGYGLTETSPVIAVNRPNKRPKPGTVGNILPNVNVRIQPLDGVQASSSASDTPGEIEVKGHSVMLGYYQDKEATKAVMTEDGWLKTGDIGKINSDGTLSLTDGRLKDLIIKHGENIGPQRIETALSAHPDVGDVSVFGIPDDKSGEQIIAYISPNESVVSADGLSEELMAWCREHLPPLWQPKRIIVKDELPKNATGKILKRQLKEDYLSSSLPV